jgi:inner membrane protein
MIKILGVGGLALLCLIPLGFIYDLVNERESTRDRALMEVSSAWAKKQEIVGPLIAIPYQYGRQHNCLSRIIFLPEELEIKSQVSVESRTRGIFDTTVYRTHLQLRGYFAGEDLRLPEFPANKILWEKAVLAIGITDSRGIEGKPELEWGDRRLTFQPGAGSVAIVERGVHVELPAAIPREGKLPFTCDLVIRGSEALMFAPTAEQTSVSVKSDWPSPSFAGAFLPSSRRVDSDQFEAAWQVSHLARDYAQALDLRTVDQEELRRLLWNSHFGVRLLQPVDLYRKMLRSLKYGVLFVGFTFVGFFLFETLAALRIHPIQYLAIGAALAVFYLLVLSLSEHLGFGVAFLAAGTANVVLITGYCKAFLGGTRSVTVLAICLSGMYVFLYVLLQLEDFALLIGSVGVFLALALFMYLTRWLNWYQLSLGDQFPRASKVTEGAHPPERQ